ncbi:Gnk2-like domain containing protein [Trema orientale]|uniref:Gnk2-like domain containing protein n=1 Tax=Trema orientale TaxID=63057 RepID=A0A2P5G274_TREOI|nr:Gnk2-like domain containing protein [Trema orientale]
MKSSIQYKTTPTKLQLGLNMAPKPLIILVPIRWCLLLLVVLIMIISSGPTGAVDAADPQAKLLNQGCSQYNATDFSDFYANLNATFSDLRAQLGGNKRFATGQQARGSDPVYAMAQCRDYLSTADCTACFTAAEKQIRNCSAANGARVIYDGCFLRYYLIL